MPRDLLKIKRSRDTLTPTSHPATIGSSNSKDMTDTTVPPHIADHPQPQGLFPFHCSRDVSTRAAQHCALGSFVQYAPGPNPHS